jgi:hypothetical protein
MRSPSKLAQLAGAGSLLLALASACGGKSSTIHADDGGSSQGGSQNTAGQVSAGSSLGASASNGGSTSLGGSVSSGAASSAGAGNAATGGYAGEACTAPPDSGECDAAIPSWYHDAATGICRPFVYGGCGGNANVYASLAECQKTCFGGSPNYDTCSQPSDCVIAGNGCCGVCDGPGVDLNSLIAFNPEYTSRSGLQCVIPLEAPAPGAPGPGQEPIACAPCPPVMNGALKYFVPDCVRGQCAITDLRQSPLTTCKTSEECVLRHGTHCCEECTTTNLVALRSDVAFQKLVCGSGDIACDDCAPPPSDAVAYCAASGHCEVGVLTAR